MKTGPLHWELLARSRANDNQCYTALISPARDEHAQYVAYGHSMIVDPWGNVEKMLSKDEDIFVAEIGNKKRPTLLIINNLRLSYFRYC